MQKSIKKSLYLKAQYAKVKEQMAYKVDATLSRRTPVSSKAPEALGSATAPWLVLASGQSVYEESLVTLQGVMPIDLSLHYVSQSNRTGFFGLDRASSFEKRFYQGIGVR